jgi:hypothetical protein
MAFVLLIAGLQGVITMTILNSPRRHPKARRCFHRAFFQWLNANQSRFLTPPFQRIKRTDRLFTFTMPGLNPLLSFGLSTWEIGVHVEYQGVWWDTLIYFESNPKAVADGYLCTLCDAEFQKIYPSREALWIEHDFEPFLDWVNKELTSTRWLALDGALNEATWAKLVDQPDPESAINFPVWIDSGCKS